MVQIAFTFLSLARVNLVDKAEFKKKKKKKTVSQGAAAAVFSNNKIITLARNWREL